MEVPPHIEANPMVSSVPALSSYPHNQLLLQDDSSFFPFPIPGRPLAVTICMWWCSTPIVFCGVESLIKA
jgi:hypothetical protein